MHPDPRAASEAPPEPASGKLGQPKNEPAERSRQLDAQLEASLLRELAHCWRNLNWNLFRDALGAPVIKLSDACSFLGQWNHHRRSIEIARQLVLQGSWGEVVEVLKHEMAHQYVDEVMLLTDETAHGPAFRQVCERIGVDSCATQDLETAAPRARSDNQPDSQGAVERTRVLKRVANLLALAESPNRHEAETAAAVAQRLMLKHNIELSQQPNRLRYGYRQIGVPKGRIQESEHILAAILAAHYFVEAIWVPAYRPHDGKRGNLLELCGTPANLEMAGYVHAFLSGSAERLWLEHKRRLGIVANRERRSYLAGVMEGFRERLKTEKERNRERGLVWVGDADLQQYHRCRHPHIRSVRLQGHGQSSTRQHGREAGRRIVLRRGVSQASAAGKPKLIE